MTAATASRWARIPLLGNAGYPLAQKELRAMIRRGRFFWAQFMYMAVLAVGVVILIVAELGDSNDPERVSNFVFGGFFLMQTVLVYLIFPAFAATSISGERMEKSFDLVLTTDLTPAEIVWGKFIGVFGSCCYFLIVTLPILTVTVLFGGKSVWEAVEGYGYLVLQAALITIYGVFVSASSHSNIRSILGCYVMAFIFGGLSLTLFSAVFDQTSSISLIQMLSQEPVEVGLTVVSIASYATVAVFGLCFLAAVQRLTPPEANRGMPIRIFMLILLGAGVLVAQYVATLIVASTAAMNGGDDRLALLMAMGIPLLVVTTLCALFFAGSPINTPLRVARGALKAPWLYRGLWLFLQGGIRSWAYALLLLVVVVLGLNYLSEFLGLESLVAKDLRARWMPAETVGAIASDVLSALFAALAAYVSLAFLLAVFEITGVLNLAIVIGCAVLANCYPATFHAMHHPPEWFHAYPVSIFMGLFDYFGRQFELPGGLERVILVHWGAAAFMATAGAWLCHSRGLAIFQLWHPTLGRMRRDEEQHEPALEN